MYELKASQKIRAEKASQKTSDEKSGAEKDPKEMSAAVSTGTTLVDASAQSSFVLSGMSHGAFVASNFRRVGSVSL